MPSWAISQIEHAIYGFFWKNKHPLVNRDILALPLREGGFNIPRLETKIQAFRLNSLRRLLTEEDAHWKHFTAYFLRVANMDLGRMTLALDFYDIFMAMSLGAKHHNLFQGLKRSNGFSGTRIQNSMTRIFPLTLLQEYRG